MGGKTIEAVRSYYDSKAYDRVVVLVKKGDKATIKEHAEKRGESLNAFVRRALYATMKNDKTV